MSPDPEQRTYFTKHLFGAGLECPTKLYYKAHDYPENQQSRPFIEHAVYNKRLLKALVRSAYPAGVYIDEDSIAQAAARTRAHLEQEQAVLFNAIFEYQQMMARVPIVVKKEKNLTVYHIRTKGFDSGTNRIVDNRGHIHSKWRSYLLDFAYELHIVQRSCRDADLRPLLVMPEKNSLSHTEELPLLLEPLAQNTAPAVLSDLDLDLLVRLDVSEHVSTIWNDPEFALKHLPKSTFEQTLTYLRDLYLNALKEGPVVGLKCKNCEFRIEVERAQNDVPSGFNECWHKKINPADIADYHVFDLIGSGTKQWIEKRIYDRRDVPEDQIMSPESINGSTGRITHQMRQSLQINKAKGKEVPDEIIRPALFDELKRWEYPLHFLDFEAGNYAVPVRSNRSPYHLVIFQFSCHTLHEDGRLNHHQWIDDRSSGYPNYELIRRLMGVSDIEKGTIVQYSDFERNALKVIRRELQRESDAVADSEKLIGWIENIIHRKDSYHPHPPYMADLSRQVRYFYYNRQMGNSLSIKDVLQSVMSHCDFLKQKYSQPYSSSNFESIVWWQSNGRGGARNPYRILMETGESPIRRGTEAMVVYGKLISRKWSSEELEAYQRALLKYCELDTLAMLMIFEHWQQKL